jgi:hypothetical protein
MNRVDSTHTKESETAAGSHRYSHEQHPFDPDNCLGCDQHDRLWQAEAAAQSGLRAALIDAIIKVDADLFKEGHGESISLWRGGVKATAYTVDLICAALAASAEPAGEPRMKCNWCGNWLQDGYCLTFGCGAAEAVSEPTIGEVRVRRQLGMRPPVAGPDAGEGE